MMCFACKQSLRPRDLLRTNGALYHKGCAPFDVVLGAIEPVAKQSPNIKPQVDIKPASYSEAEMDEAIDGNTLDDAEE